MFEAWLKEQREHDKRDGVKYRTLASQPRELTTYVRKQLDELYACLDKAAESVPPSQMGEVSQRWHWEVRREEFTELLAQTVQSVAHLLLAVGCRGEELERRYRKYLGELTPVQAVDPAEEAEETAPASVTEIVVKTLNKRRPLGAPDGSSGTEEASPAASETPPETGDAPDSAEPPAAPAS